MPTRTRDRGLQMIRLGSFDLPYGPRQWLYRPDKEKFNLNAREFRLNSKKPSR